MCCSSSYSLADGSKREIREARCGDDGARTLSFGIRSDHSSTLLRVSSSEIVVEEIACDCSVSVNSSSIE